MLDSPEPTWCALTASVVRLFLDDHYTIGYSISENSTVTLNPASEYLAGCNGCTEYATGMACHSEW